MVRLPLVLALLGTAAGCSQGDSVDAIGRVDDELSNLGANQQLTTDPGGNSETSVVAVPINSDRTSVVVGFNPNYSGDAQGWAFSTNGGSSWVTHLSTDSGYAWPPLPSPLSDGRAFASFYSDPALAWTGYPGGVAFVTVVASTKHVNADIGLAVSTDGGSTFTRTALVSEAATAPGVDQPVAATDPTNHSVWVWWRTTSGGSYLRPIYFTPTGIPWMAPVIDLAGKLPVNTARSGSINIAIKPAPSVGQNPTIFLAYPDRFTQNGTCGASPPPGTASVTWRFSWSTDGGQTFSTHTIVHDPQWPYCVLDQPNGQNRNRPALAYDPVSGYVLTAINQSVKNVDGAPIGTRVVLHQSNDHYATSESWLPLCNANADRQLIRGAPDATETVCNQFDPTLAVALDGPTSSHAAFTWHDTRDSPDGRHVDVWGASARPGSPYDYMPRTMNRLTPLASNVPWLETDTSGNTAW